MSVFGIEVEQSQELTEFIIETNKRLQRKDVIKNPFTENSRLHLTRNTLVVCMTPLWPNFMLYGGIFTLILLIMISNIKPLNLAWFIAPLIFFVLSFFWSKSFLFVMLKKGMKKKGYNGKLTRLKKDELIKRLLKCHKEMS